MKCFASYHDTTIGIKLHSTTKKHAFTLVNGYGIVASTVLSNSWTLNQKWLPMHPLLTKGMALNFCYYC